MSPPESRRARADPVGASLPAPPPVLPAVAAIARVVMLEALRGRVAWLMLAVLVAGVGLSEFTAQIAITESREVARGVLGAWLRSSSVFVVALFVATSMARDWNDKGMELVIAQALPRAAYLGGRLLGYAGVALACAAACAALVAFAVPAASAALWGATLAGEALIVAAMTLLCMLTFNHMPLGLSAVAAFYLLSRAIDAILLIGTNPVAGAGASHAVITGVLEALAFVLPDLDRFARADWLIGPGPGLAEAIHALAQTAVYLLLLAGAALFDLERKVL